MTQIRADLIVVEQVCVNLRRKLGPSAVPRSLDARKSGAYVGSNRVDRFGFGISAHQGYACDACAILAHEAVDDSRSEFFAFVGPEVFAVTSRASAWTVGYVDGQRHLVWHFLKDYVCVGVFHFSLVWMYLLCWSVLVVKLRLSATLI